MQLLLNSSFVQPIVGAAHSPDRSIHQLVGVLVAYMLDSFVQDDSFADDSLRAWLDNCQHLVERMAAVGLDIVNRYFDQLEAVQALASIAAVNWALLYYFELVAAVAEYSLAACEHLKLVAASVVDKQLAD